MPAVRTFAPAPPEGWIDRVRLLTETGVSDRKFAEWAPKLGLRTCLVSRGRAGVEAYYPPGSIRMIKRLLEISATSPRDMNRWLWQLWLEGFDVDICGWAKKHISSGLKGLVRRKSSGPRLIRNRVRGHSHRAAFATYSHLVAAGRAGPDREVSIHNVDPPIFDLLLKIGGLPSNTKLPAGELKKGEHKVSFKYLCKVLDTATEDEIEQARRDWRMLARWSDAAKAIDWNSISPELDLKFKALTGAPSDPPSWRARKAQRQRPWPAPPLVQNLVALWPELAARATVLPFLIDLRRSPTLGQMITTWAATIDLVFERCPRRLAATTTGSDA